MQTFIAYVRVSTGRQGESGLGLDAQRMAIQNYVRGRGELIGEAQEIESGRKAGKERPQLQAALANCRKAGAALVVGKLDRLSRDLRYFLALIDDSGVDIRFADLPDVCPSTDEGRMILVSMANFAEFEARRISTRTKAALAAARLRGVQLGVTARANLRQDIEARKVAADMTAERLRPLLVGLADLSLRDKAARLNAAGLRTATGAAWTHVQVGRIERRLANAADPAVA